MKNIRIRNKQNKIISDQNIYEDPTDFINHIVSTNYWGKPERWILENSEFYEQEDILKEEDRLVDSEIVDQNEDGTFSSKKIIQKWVLLKPDYIIEIEDLDKNYDYLLGQVHIKRKSEYPPMEDYLDAIVKNDEDQKNKYIEKCLEIKRKYPLPIREI